LTADAAAGQFALAGVPDPDERLSADDMATRREEEFRAAAVRNHLAAARRTEHSQPGVCMNCREPCLPLAVYCDRECRADHEQRLGAGR
jgi:hypothetical protein